MSDVYEEKHRDEEALPFNTGWDLAHTRAVIGSKDRV
jgi:hypothetical protein